MSTLDQCIIASRSAESLKKTGKSLSESMYRRPLTIALSGELGAGKTTFVQGFAAGLGIKDRIVSPSFALEQRYGNQLAHIDLYRLKPKQAEEFLMHAEDFPGIRAIEWSNRINSLDAGIEIAIHDRGESAREVHITFREIEIPDDAYISSLIKEVKLPPHIVDHMNAVSDVSMKVAKDIVKQGRIVRLDALSAAAKLHDLLRFVDFKTWEGTDVYTPTAEEKDAWKKMKDRYGSPHEDAAYKFLSERGYKDIATILQPHRGMEKEGQEPLVLQTIEQKILAYADKRVLYDKIVTLDERFDDFIVRYASGAESMHARAWRERMKKLEFELFPDGAPF